MNTLKQKEVSSTENTNNNISLAVTQVLSKPGQLEPYCSQTGADSYLFHQLNNIAEHHRLLHCGEHLFHQGAEFRNLYIVSTGVIKLYLTTYEGTEQTLNFYFPGELLSLGSIGTHQHNTSAIALDTASVCRIPFGRIETLCHRQPVLYDQLFAYASQEIANMHSMKLNLGQRPAEERFAMFLLDIARRCEISGYYHRELHLFMSRHDIANYLCLADETISRLFSKFSADGILSTNRKTVQILDFSKLEMLANVQHPELLQALV